LRVYNSERAFKAAHKRIELTVTDSHNQRCPGVLSDSPRSQVPPIPAKWRNGYGDYSAIQARPKTDDAIQSWPTDYKGSLAYLTFRLQSRSKGHCSSVQVAQDKRLPGRSFNIEEVVHNSLGVFFDPGAQQIDDGLSGHWWIFKVAE
jgi:hypothetical protein